MNARFWILQDTGPVKLTLSPGESLSWFRGEKTEEGYDFVSDIWKHTGANVVWTRFTDGRDCDGRLTTDSEVVCSLDSLQPPRDGGRIGPAWKQVCEYQRDYTAEAAGY